MTTTRLSDTVQKSGLQMEAIAAELGISRVTLNEKLSGRSDFKVSEAKKLKEILKMSNKDFFAIFFDQ